MLKCQKILLFFKFIIRINVTYQCDKAGMIFISQHFSFYQLLKFNDLSMRWFFWPPKTYAKILWVRKYLQFYFKIFASLNLCSYLISYSIFFYSKLYYYLFTSKEAEGQGHIFWYIWKCLPIWFTHHSPASQILWPTLNFATRKQACTDAK